MQKHRRNKISLERFFGIFPPADHNLTFKSKYLNSPADHNRDNDETLLARPKAAGCDQIKFDDNP